MAEVKLESEAIGSGGAPLTQKRESLFQDAFRRLLRNRASVIGGTIVIVLILMAIFALYKKVAVMDSHRMKLINVEKYLLK